MPDIYYIVGAVVALMGAGGLLRLLGRVSSGSDREDEQSSSKSPAPPEPEKTATEHENETIDDQIEAVVKAAAEHDVPASIVADDLEWLESDDVPGA